MRKAGRLPGDAEVRAALAGAAARPPSSDFDLNPGAHAPPSARLRPAAVLIPIAPRRPEPSVILTRRPDTMRHHPGQVAFPGGKIDAGDAGPAAAALREAREEIGLDPARVDILGAIPEHVTVTGFRIHPIVGLVPDDFRPSAAAGEVEEVFEMPLGHVLDPRNYQVRDRRWQGRRRRYYVVPYGPHYVWGATARILRTFADCIGGADAH